MASSRNSFFLINLLLFLLISFFQLSLQQPPTCREFERLALIQFKNSFLIDKNVHGKSLAYPKVDLWKTQGINCCSWEGVTCDQHTGRVVGLDLSSSGLFGSINSSSSLFRLDHLQYLNLADNHFNYSSIPPAFGNLSKLSYLNLSESWFFGQVPFEISKLSKLTKLDLSWNVDSLNQSLLELKNQDFKSLIQNLSRLEDLRLSSVNINSSVPYALANLSSLTYLDLTQCGLFEEFPNAIFELSKLEKVFVRDNWRLTGVWPEFHFSSSLKELSVSDTSFSGEFPKSFGLVSSLEYLEARNCNFSGELPSSFSNLTQLRFLSLRNNSFYGSLDSSFSKLTQLRFLGLSVNQISGPFPSWLTNLTQLTHVYLGRNMIHGTLPSSISRLENLELFYVGFNKLTGTVEFDTFLAGLEHLKYLSLSGNSFSLLTKNSSIVPKLLQLQLGSCNLKEFPAFLHNQDQLEILDLSSNKIHGQIPKWLMKLSANLLYLDLHSNSLTSFEDSGISFPSSLLILDLNNNFLKGPLPIPPRSIIYYSVAMNSFDGEIPFEFCYITTLQWLDLSRNNLSGIILQCLGNRSKSLSNLSLGQNNLQGKLPRSLANCKNLELLDLSDNQIRDTFPLWLGVLPRLKIIILRSNRLYGAVIGPKSGALFPKLRIIDLSQNEFSGPLPFEYFDKWNAVASLSDDIKYLSVDQHLQLKGITAPFQLLYSMTITNKGNKMEYPKILEIFTAIDLSCNKFSGQIPEGVGNLRGLQLLNLSNNILVGPIPQELGSLSNLEALDLSNNKLKGGIPTELAQITFLAVFNVSNNLLTGPIPRSSQFATFENSSFEGNPGLCGMPLSKNCGNHAPPLPSSSEENRQISLLSEIGWRAVLIGCGCGFLGGVVLGVKVFSRQQEWLMETFRIIKQGRMRNGNRRRSNRQIRRR